MDEVPVAMEPTIILRDARSSDRSWCDDRRVAVQGAGAHVHAGKATTDVAATEAAHVTAAKATGHVAAAEPATHMTTTAEPATVSTSTATATACEGVGGDAGTAKRDGCNHNCDLVQSKFLHGLYLPFDFNLAVHAHKTECASDARLSDANAA
jgi:hypothetical protein